jgi:ornithine cyclodeaminase
MTSGYFHGNTLADVSIERVIMVRNSDSEILYLNRADVEIACGRIDSVAVIDEVFRMHSSGQTILPDEAYLSWKNSHGEQVRSLNMPGYVGGALSMAGTKIINSNIHNPERGVPRASGLTLLYDDTSVRVMCIMEGAYLSSLRTASVTALAVDVLSSAAISCAAIIGAGTLAMAHVDLLVRRFPQLRLLQVFDSNREQVIALQQRLSSLLQEHHVDLYAAATAEEAIRAAQLIVPVTTNTTGYIRFEWLQPGSLLVNVSLDDPLPDVVLKADTVIVDDWNLIKNDSRRLLGRMYRQGLIIGPDESETTHHGQRRIDACFGDVIMKTRVGRARADDIILVNPFGLAIEDVALASYVYKEALKSNIGIWLRR